MLKKLIFFSLLLFLLGPDRAAAQFEGPRLGNGPWVFETFEQDYIKVSLLARGMDRPFGMVFIPGTQSEEYPLGDILITERYTGNVLLYRNGALREEPVLELQDVIPVSQLFDIELHPDFEDNGFVYFTWIKQLPHPDGSDKLWATTALARGRWDGRQLQDVREIFEADAWSDNICGASSRMHFLADGTLLLGASHRCDEAAPQNPSSGIGKIMRLNDDGSIPRDNPFAGMEGALPEVYAWGIRSVMDFTTHPQTGEIWELENGPQGGDEVNILKPGANYGWPLATFGRDYDGTRFSPRPWVEGTELPVIFWVPSVTVSSLTFYTGDAFPRWKNNLLVTTMMKGRIPNTGHIERIVMNEHGEIRREQMLNAFNQRFRYVLQGDDGLLYVLTDSTDGALLRLEPASAEEASQYGEVSLVTETEAAEEELVFEGLDCRTCHRTVNAPLGPSWTEIAERYAADASTISMLARSIIEGGSGNWGDTPMPPHPDLDMDEARDIVRRILAL